MKTAKQQPSDASSSRRAQPLRQTRNNPPRSSVSRGFGSRASIGDIQDPPSPDQPVEIFPAITHFADAITALPKELVRHFTLLKEVDAKIFPPEEDLRKLVDAALNAPLPERRQPPPVEAQNSLASTSAPMSAQGSVNGSVANGYVGSVASAPDVVGSYNAATAAWDPANLPRRQLFNTCALTMQNMLVSLDEKNHVISTAGEALNKQLARLEDCFQYIETEISEEARYGSTTHWAYPENRIGKTGAGSASRREATQSNNLSAAAQALVDEAAHRSDLRKQALAAKKGRNHHAESDFDDHHDGRHRESGKKVHGNSKVRKAVDSPSSVGLGITNGVAANGNPPKRRKVEKGPGGGAVMERALSSVFGSNGTATKTKANSPRETPQPEGTKKKARGTAATNGQTRKRNGTVNSLAMSPSVASSPIRSTFPEPKTGARGSPIPNGGRPASSRARQNSIQSVLENTRQPRPASSASNKQDTNGAGTPDLGAAVAIAGRNVPEVKASMKESATNSNGEHVLEDAEKQEPEMVGGLAVGNRKDSTMKHEETENNGGAMQDIQPTTITTTKSGRASKPATPAIPSFPEPVVRSRSGRNALETASSNKRSHKKGAGAAAQLIAQQNIETDDAESSLQGDDDDAEIDANEPTYCYCNGVSYGEMVACDGVGCEKEWFHLECVGLKVAPKGNAKWYCDDCKERLKPKRFNSR